jgi:hypothetical protein
MINTWDGTRNHLLNPQRHESQNTQHRYSHAPTDIVTLIDSPMETKWHIFTNTICGNRGQVCVRIVPEGSVTANTLEWP